MKGKMKRKRMEQAASDAKRPHPQRSEQDRRIAEWVSEQATSPPLPLMRMVNERGRVFLTPDCPDELVGFGRIMKALATRNPHFADGFLHQLQTVATGPAGVSERDINFILAVIEQIGPRDQLETMLAFQMAITQMACARAGHALLHAQTIMQEDHAHRVYNKLSRTYVDQIRGLDEHRDDKPAPPPDPLLETLNQSEGDPALQQVDELPRKSMLEAQGTAAKQASLTPLSDTADQNGQDHAQSGDKEKMPETDGERRNVKLGGQNAA